MTRIRVKSNTHTAANPLMPNSFVGYSARNKHTDLFMVEKLGHFTPMPDYTIESLVGISPVRLGMSREEARLAMSEPPRSFRKTPESRYETDAYYQNAFQVFYGGDQPSVDFIELSGGLAVRRFITTLMFSRRLLMRLSLSFHEIRRLIRKDARFLIPIFFPAYS